MRLSCAVSGYGFVQEAIRAGLLCGLLCQLFEPTSFAPESRSAEIRSSRRMPILSRRLTRVSSGTVAGFVIMPAGSGIHSTSRNSVHVLRTHRKTPGPFPPERPQARAARSTGQRVATRTILRVYHRGRACATFVAQTQPQLGRQRRKWQHTI